MGSPLAGGAGDPDRLRIGRRTVRLAGLGSNFSRTPGVHRRAARRMVLIAGACTVRWSTGLCDANVLSAHRRAVVGCDEMPVLRRMQERACASTNLLRVSQGAPWCLRRGTGLSYRM